MGDLEETLALLESAREKLQNVGINLEWKLTGKTRSPLWKKYLEDNEGVNEERYWMILPRNPGAGEGRTAAERV